MPGRPYTFGRLQMAQALGDLRALERARPTGRAAAPARPRGRRAAAARGSRRGDAGVSPRITGAARQPAARPARPAAAAGSRPVRARRVRRHRRPGAQEAHPRGLRPRQPRPAAAGLRPARFRPSRLGRRRLRRPGAQGGPGARPHRLPRRRLGAGSPTASASCPARSTTTPPSTRLLRDPRRPGGDARHPGQRCLLPLHPAGDVPGGPQADAAHPDGRQRRARRLATRRHREAVRARPAERDRAEHVSSTTCSPPRTSSGSTTTSARRRCRTCWPCGSRTRCSSRCGTATSSTPCRSRWPRTSASAPGPASTTPPAPPATCCRTTCCSWWRSRRWRSPSPSTPRRSAPRRPRCSAPSSCRDDLAEYAIRGQYDQGWLGGQRVVAYLEEEGVPQDLHDRDLRRGPAGRRDPALGRCPVLPAHREAAAPPGHRDRGHLQEGAAPAVRRDRHRGARRTTSS